MLLRAIAPAEGVTEMERRRGGRTGPALADGPAKLCQALAIDGALDGHDLCTGGGLWFEAGDQIPDGRVIAGPRVGLNNVPEPWKSMPWRFRIAPLAHRKR